MPFFEKIAQGIDVSGIVAELRDNPQLWDEHKTRTVSPSSPHYGVPDIWVRYRPLKELASPESYREPHFAEFYPAWKLLPSLHPIVYDLMARVKAVYLGGILITKIPPGGSVKPHSDAHGGWHPHFMNKKVYLGIESNSGCVNYCGTEEATIRQGDAVSFDNLVVHSVVNNGKTDRITGIICMRVE